MLSASVFHLVSSLLLLECNLQVKCKQFSRISDMKFVPNESRSSLLFGSLHVMAVVLHFSALLNNFTNILTSPNEKFLCQCHL